MKILIIVDMQNDFITGSLGTKEAQAILPRVLEKVKTHSGPVLFTKDTHNDDYLSAQEGTVLPVKHCIKGTPGHDLWDGLAGYEAVNPAAVFEKNTFGSTALIEYLREFSRNTDRMEIELIGLCTDICVVSNALLIKAHFPEWRIAVDSACCAGVTPEKHLAALETMRSCQIEVR